jgi:macrophage erythroblast attacher
MHVKKYLSPWHETHMKEIQQCMALLAFAPSTDCTSYKSLYDPRRWTNLALEFCTYI